MRKTSLAMGNKEKMRGKKLNKKLWENYTSSISTGISLRVFIIISITLSAEDDACKSISTKER